MRRDNEVFELTDGLLLFRHGVDDQTSLYYSTGMVNAISRIKDDDILRYKGMYVDCLDEANNLRERIDALARANAELAQEVIDLAGQCRALETFVPKRSRGKAKK